MEATPMWVLENMMRPQGRRLPKRPPVVKPGDTECETCKKEMTWQESEWEGGKRYCKICCPPKSWQTRVGFNPFPVVRDSRLPAVYGGMPVHSALEDCKGNLDNHEYQFWIGHRNPDYVSAMCRCCRAEASNQGARIVHKKLVTHGKTGDSCMRILCNVYKRMRAEKSCVVCLTTTKETNWGIPMCSKPSCKQAWMFSRHSHFHLFEKMLDKVKGVFGEDSQGE